MSNIELKKIQLRSELWNLVESGDMTDTEANEWYNMKVEQWEGGDL